MNTEPRAASSSTQQDEQTTGDSINTAALLEACILDADHDALQEHLENNHMEQSMLDRCLMLGLQIVQMKEQQMRRIAPVLQLLWQFGAKWNPDSLLEHQMTPYHLICLSTGDHHELIAFLIQSSERTLLHVMDDYGFTALMYAVKNANINCLRSLIAHGAEVKLDNSDVQPISLAIEELQDHSKHSLMVMIEIFDLLLDNGADVNIAGPHAMSLDRVECIKKLIMKRANLEYWNGYLLQMAARYGVNMLKCLFERGFDQNSRDRNGRSLLWWVTTTGTVDAIRYLLDQGVPMPTYVFKTCQEHCKHCGVDMLELEDYEQYTENPCLEAIIMDKLDIVQLFEECGCKNYKHFIAFRLAVLYDSVTVLDYLHRKYKHSLNINYNTACARRTDPKHKTLLIEACRRESIKIVEYVLVHGADPNKVDTGICSSALFAAMQCHQIENIALLICNGVDISFRSNDSRYGDVLPFEALVLREHRHRYVGYIYVVEMFLVSGCSCGVFSLDADHKFKDTITFEFKNMMMKWKVHENNVKPLKQQCRRMILKHLSPRASKMIEKLPLPQCLIKYLSIPELDEIVNRYRRMRIAHGHRVHTIGERFSH